MNELNKQIGISSIALTVNTCKYLRAIRSQLGGIVLLFCLIFITISDTSGDVNDVNSDVVSPIITYQYFDALDNFDYQNITSQVVTYQYLDSLTDVTYQTLTSPSVSYFFQYQYINLCITPCTTIAFGSLLVGNTADRTFNVSNVGTSTISGTASVASPFSVVDGGSYTLAPGQFTNTTIRYAPTSAGNNNAYVTFTGNGYQTRQVTGSAYTDPTPTTGMIVGQVTNSDTHEALNGIGITVVGPGGDIIGSSIPETISHVIGGQAGRYSITGLPPNAHYQVFATTDLKQFNMITNLNDVAVVAGQTTTADIALTPVSPQNQPPSPTPENTPVVLVRGFGKDDDYATDDYFSWEEMRIALETNGFIVWNCNEPEDGIMGGAGHVINGELGIEYNAGQLTKYIQQKAEQYKTDRSYYPPQIHIVAHSMGGLITRSALGNNDRFTFPTFSVKVGKVVMLATPNCGSPVADYVTEVPFGIVLNLLNGSWVSTSNLRTSEMRGHYNPSHPWPSVPLYLFSASNSRYGYDKEWNGGPDLCPLGGLAIGNMNFWNMIGGTEERINDGAATKPSVNGVFWYRDLWGSLHSVNSVTFDPVEKWSMDYGTYYVANPVQSITDSDIGKSLDHFFLLTDSAVIDWVVNTLKNPDPTLTPYTTTSFVKAQGEVKLDAGGASQQALSMQPFESLGGTVTNGATVTVPVASDANTTLTFQLMASDTNIIFRLNDPCGTLIDANTPQTNTNVQYSVMIADSNLISITYTISNPNPATGTWQAVMDGSSITTIQAVYNLMVFGDSNVGLIPQTIPPCNQGQDVVVSCTLADFSTNPVIPVMNASITATILLPDSSTTNLTLFDDGWHNDGVPNDGVYAAVLTDVLQAGSYSIAYRATGTNGEGQALQRVATGGFSVSSGHGSLWGDPVYENLDTDGDGIADFLEVKCWVNPTADGNYILAGDLVNASGTNRFSKSAAFAADGNGPTMVTLIFDLAEMRAAGGGGIYHIENLQLFEVTSTGTAWLDAYQGSSVVNIQVADLDMDGDVDFVDFAIFANHWMDDTCSDPDWCEGTDFDHSGSVDMLDLATFAKYWLEGI